MQNKPKTSTLFTSVVINFRERRFKSYSQKALQGHVLGAAHFKCCVCANTLRASSCPDINPRACRYKVLLVLHVYLVHSAKEFIKTLFNLCKLSYKAENPHLGLLDYIYKN